MRILTLVKSGHGGRWAIQQLAGLGRLDVSTDVLIPEGPTAALARELPNTTVHVAPGSSDPSNAEVVRRWPALIRRIMATHPPDVIHSHFVATTLAARMVAGRTPVVFQVPGPLHLEGGWSRAMDLYTARRHDRWIAGCQFTRDLLHQAGVSISRTSLAYYCGDASRWSHETAPIPREVLGMAASDVLIGMVAFVYPPQRRFGGRGLKGHEDYLAAMRMVVERRPSSRCMVVGGAWHGAASYAHQLRDAAARELGDRLLWLDTVPDVLPYYRTMDIAVHPSLSENLGGAAESMRTGVATVATAIGGFPDLISDGQTGCLVPPRSPEVLADVLCKLIDDQAQRMRLAEAGRARAFTLLDPTVNAIRVDAALRAAMDGRDAPQE